MTIVWLVVALIGCLIVQAFFAASEIALVSADDLKVRAESEGGHARSRVLDELLANRDRPMRITTGETRPGRTMWVYGRKRALCLRCGTPVRNADQGALGEERVTYWCPRCQEGPGPSPAAWRPGRG